GVEVRAEGDGRLAPAARAGLVLEPHQDGLAVIDAAEARLERRDEREPRVEELEPDEFHGSKLGGCRRKKKQKNESHAAPSSARGRPGRALRQDDRSRFQT